MLFWNGSYFVLHIIFNIRVGVVVEDIIIQFPFSEGNVPLNLKIVHTDIQ